MMPGRRSSGIFSGSQSSVTSSCNYSFPKFEINKKLRFHIIFDPVWEDVSIKSKNAIIVGVQPKKWQPVFESNDEKPIKIDKALKATVDHVNRDVAFCTLGTWTRLKHRPRGILIDPRALHKSITNLLPDNFRRIFGIDPPAGDKFFLSSLKFCYLVAKLLKNYYSVATGKDSATDRVKSDADAPAVTAIFHGVSAAPAMVSLRQDSFFDEMCFIYIVYSPYLAESVPESPKQAENIARANGALYVMKVEQKAALLADRLGSFSYASDKVIQRLLIRPVNLYVSKKDKARRRICI